MRDKQQKEIDGIAYELYPVSPFVAWDVFQRLCAYGLGPILKAVLAKQSEKSKTVLDMDIEDALPAIADALETVFTKLPAGEMKKITQELMKEGLIVDGKKVPSLELHFNKHGVLHLLKAVRFALEVNFGDFLPGLQGVVKATQE